MPQKADHDAVPPICVAIRRALDVHSESERAFAKRIKASPSQLQRWSGTSTTDGPQAPNLVNIRRLEVGLRPDAPAGWLLIAAGAVECPTTTEDAIRGDVRLNEDGVTSTLDALRSAIKFSSRGRP